MEGRTVAKDRLDDEAAHIAAWVLEFAGPTYGPGGGHKLIHSPDDSMLRTRSAATALRDVPMDHPGLEPYRRLAVRLQSDHGDGATTGLLLAAHLVQGALRAHAPRAALLDGFALARRQSLATLRAVARPMEPVQLLRPVSPQDAWPEVVLAGLDRLAQQGGVRLDDVHIAPHDGAWLDGLLIEPDGPRRGVPDARVLVVDAPRVKPTGDASYRLALGQDAGGAEDADLRRLVDRVAELGVDLLVCPQALGALKDRAGCLVLEHASKSLVARLEAATGARRCATLHDATATDLGRATLRPLHPRHGGWLLEGPGPGATFCIPLASPVGEAWHDEAERFLRLAGTVLADARGVPGGGRWQRRLAKTLRSAAPMAPDRSPLGVEVAARAFDRLADHVVRNMGRDPIDEPTLDDVPDVAHCVEATVAGAFDVARTVLRIDARHEKAAQDRRAIRGGDAPMGSPKGMPGDIPPLM